MDAGILGSMLGVLMVVFITLIVMSFSSLEINELGLDYSAISKSVNPEPFKPGIHFLGIGHHFIKYPKVVQTIEFAGKRTRRQQGTVRSRTSDGLEVTVDISFQYRIRPDKLYELYMRFGDHYKQIFERVAVDILTDGTTNYTAYQFFYDRASIGTQMRTHLGHAYHDNCLAIIEFFQLRQIDLPDDFETAIQDTEVTRQDISKASAEQQATYIELDTVVKKAQFNKNIFVNLARGSAQEILINNNATVESLVFTQRQVSTAYQGLKTALQLTGKDLLGLIKSKLVKQPKGKENMVISLHQLNEGILDTLQ